ncbi:MAG: LacI family DNA-binding transcriptional regulator [Deinococcales bacterium]
MSKLTIHDIAKAAGVSTGTVSRALNDRAGVNPETKAQILELVAQFGYHPDVGARQLARGARSVVGITRYSDTSLRNPYYALLLDAIQTALLDSGYSVHILRNDSEMLERQFAGIIVPGIRLSDTRPNSLKRLEIPFVAIGLGAPSPEIASVELENRAGMLEVMRHLFALGHRQIAHLTGTPIGVDAQVRLETYKEALAEAGLMFDPALVFDGRFTELGAYRATQTALKSKKFSALVCASDEMALGAIQALEDAGLRVPQDISVTGFDDLQLESFQAAALTSVRQPLERIGREAATLLLEQIAQKKPRCVLIYPDFIARASSGVARKGT